MARPRKEFDDKTWQQLEEMCKIHCTKEEISNILSVSEDTIERRVRETHDQSFAEYYKRYADGGKMSLRRKQWDVAMNGNVSMLIWLGKQELNQSDKQQIEQTTKDVTTLDKVMKQLDDTNE